MLTFQKTKNLILLFAALVNIQTTHPFSSSKKNLKKLVQKTTPTQLKEESTEITITPEVTPTKLSTLITEEPAVTQATTEEPKLTQEEQELLFNKELSELCSEYQQQLAQLEAIKTNPDFIKLTEPLQLQRKELEEKLNQIIVQFIPEMKLFYQQLQNLVKKYRTES